MCVCVCVWWGGGGVAFTYPASRMFLSGKSFSMYKVVRISCISCSWLVYLLSLGQENQMFKRLSALVRVSPGLLTICTENQKIPVGNQMDQKISIIPSKIFRVPQWYSSFLIQSRM